MLCFCTCDRVVHVPESRRLMGCTCVWTALLIDSKELEISVGTSGLSFFCLSLRDIDLVLMSGRGLRIVVSMHVTSWLRGGPQFPSLLSTTSLHLKSRIIFNNNDPKSFGRRRVHHSYIDLDSSLEYCCMPRPFQEQTGRRQTSRSKTSLYGDVSCSSPNDCSNANHTNDNWGIQCWACYESISRSCVVGLLKGGLPSSTERISYTVTLDKVVNRQEHTCQVFCCSFEARSRLIMCNFT